MEARNRSLSDWLTRVRTRQLVLPRFQRFEAWTHRHVTGLLDTVLRGLPAGALLILEIGDKEPFVSRPVVGAPQTGEKIGEHLLDGQQRLTALWRSLTDNYEDRTYFVDVRRHEEDENEDAEPGIPHVVSQAKWIKNGRGYPVWLGNPQDVWGRGLIPVHLLRPDQAAEVEFKHWARAATGDDPDEMLEVFQIGTELRTRFAHFNIPFLSLPVTTPSETALDVFVKMNTSAQPLSTYDIVVAQVEAATGFSLHELVEQLVVEAPGLEHYADPADVILGAGAYLNDKPARRGVMLGEGFCQSLIDHWPLLVRAARRSTAFLDEERVFDSARLPTDPVIPLLVALWAHVPDGMDREGEARLLIRKFLWRGFLTDRYERASNTRALADYKTLKGRIEGTDVGAIAVFDEEQHPLPSIDEIRLAGWPKKKDRLARALMLVSLREGGHDIADNSPATRENLGRREYHHLFPVAFLKPQGRTEGEIFRALNCALVTWKTNRSIAAKSPAEYIRRRTDASSLGEPEIRKRLSTHLIDYDMLVAGDYDAFLSGRAEQLRNALTDLAS